MKEYIRNVLEDMNHYLSPLQMKELQRSLLDNAVSNEEKRILSNDEYMKMFLSSKRIEGCSPQTEKYYKQIITKFVEFTDKKICYVTTDDVRLYMAHQQDTKHNSKITLDNHRRIFSSFFSWLEAEDYIIKNPIKRIHKLRSSITVKETISDETMEKLRVACECERDLAIIDLLYSTGMRIGELVGLDIADVNFEERECIVLGKGDKERNVYFDAKTKLHLEKYLDSRNDGNPALFVSLDKPHNRLHINGINHRLKKIASKAGVKNIHPHKFRRTMATRAIDKGMPVEQVQQILGHTSIETTMRYAMVNQANVKASHRKYMT